MSLALVNQNVLEAIIGSIGSTGSTNKTGAVLALLAQPLWDGPPTINVGGRTVHVSVAASPLAVRESLRHQRVDGDLQVLLTPLADAALGLDVCVRLVKGRVLRADVASSARSILGLSGIDPDLAKQKWLLDDLASLVINEHVALPFRGRLLDLDTAWQAWFSHRLGTEVAPTSATELLALLSAPATATAATTLTGTVGEAFEQRFAQLGLPTAVLIELVSQHRGDDLIPYGLLLDVVCCDEAGDHLRALQQTARIRLESAFGRSRVTAGHERVWADAAVELAATAERSVAQHSVAKQWRDRAERLLAELDAAPLAALSGTLRSGLDQGVARIAGLLLAQWATTPIDRSVLLTCAEDLQTLRGHPEAVGPDGRATSLDVVEAALRLTQRRGTDPPEPAPAGDVFVLATRYGRDLAWVDRCRAVLIDGATGPDVERLATGLLAHIDHERRTFDTAFAREFAEWSPPPVDTTSPNVVPIEGVLDSVVAPIASGRPTLLIVLDGGSIAAVSNLLASLRAGGWTLLGRREPAEMVIAAAALPSVTDCSRASLLAGALAMGAAPDEKRTFAAHPGLRAIAAKSVPVLFHKAELVGSDGVALATKVRDAILDTSQRVVGIVVNAIDDHLSGGSQVIVGWDVGDIRPLGDLLDCARDAGRAVVITADHGHVIDAGRSVLRSTAVPDRGDRWRTTHEPAGDGEIEVRGARVVGGGGQVVLAVDDRIRYAGKKHGYHGGLTPQEVLVPLAVLVRGGAEVPGWRAVESFEPPWWEPGALPQIMIEAEPAPAVVVPPAVATGGSKRARPKATPKVPQLFEPEPAAVVPAVVVPAAGDWIAQLFASPLFVAQRAAAGRQPIDDVRLRSLFRAIRKFDFMPMRDALTLAVGGQPAKIRGEINTMRRILNVDGYEVLALQDDRLVLSVELLAAQFGLDVRDVRGTG